MTYSLSQTTPPRHCWPVKWSVLQTVDGRHWVVSTHGTKAAAQQALDKLLVKS